MSLEPNAIILYVENLAISSHFYRDLLSTNPEEASPTFNAFRLSNGMSLGLKAKHAVEPSPHNTSGNGELAFIRHSDKEVDELFAKWQEKRIHIIFSPDRVPYGYTFVALDPDGNRLRVISLENKE
ncbi:bleomycin resistance protein (plasmid) [Legionella adelaidensis]|uniref:Bleomycin resistance protein n=1 Tax=Legionella adelaidensis TaxID=45056 RepID=A0A0W0R5E3_9GAMM|nr:VOC family protein [Legionella adelaidensis]KTC66280.1 bleomycin resistance protein [Legionella adelaidensis]VEH84876.1 bleomycin resistance protein [Legionella adelaidensis]